ncbi:MAG: hypothetical protein C0425_01290 [Chlorobiaceae bacterium]|nr:hypothetical protein [Chlorobiaceae bacterium]MBA4308956.1 hypothetical protein [Chlorobiaceae bacterium]
MRSYIFTLATLALLFFVPSTLLSGDKSGKSKGKKWDKLELTQEQKGKIENFKDEHKRAMIDLKANLKKLKMDQKKLFNEVNINREAVLNKVGEINAAKNKIAISKATVILNIQQSLTDKQKELFKEYKLYKKFDKDKNRCEKRKKSWFW